MNRGLIRLIRLALQVFCWFLLMPLMRALRGKERTPPDSFVSLWMALVLFTAFFGAMAALGRAWGVPFFALGVILLMPWTVARRVFIPLGMSRAARFFASLAGWTFSRDRHGGGLIAGAWAISRQRVPDREDMARIEAARDAAPVLTAAQVLATGLLAAARGDVESARALLASVEEIGAATTPTLVHALAREWLVADAAERGQWQRVVALCQGMHARAPLARSRATRLLGAVAARLTGKGDAPGPVRLWLAWLLAPARRHTFALVRRARMTPARKDPAPAPLDHRLDTTLRPDHYADALSAHVYTLARAPSRLCADDLQRLADIWDRALADPATRQMVMDRAAILGARSGERALHALSEAVARDIAGMARAAGVPLAERALGSPTLSYAQGWLHNELLGEIEIAFDALQIRAMDKRALSSMDEWREWLSLRAVYARAAGLGGIELRRLAFPHVHHTVCKLAVWLWNQREEHVMANAMFRWLLDEALAVGDAEAIELQSRNWDAKL